MNRQGDDESSGGERTLALQLDDFAWDALREEALKQGVPAEELASFAVLYYLADADSGRISRQVSGSPLRQT